MIRTALLSGLAAIATITASAPSLAQQGGARVAQAGDFARFAPQPDTDPTRLDFSYWNTALRWFVLRMGRSLREYAPRPEESTGSHLVFGHDSAYRLEGNRVAFSMMPDDVKKSLTDYRRDLEQLADSVPLNRLGRNEQLAYWINLHNVAMIEQIALAYPLSKPSTLRVGSPGLPLDEAPFITVAGVRMSPRDIRTRIVYPNWRDPKVIYGFWHGDIGGPSISRSAFHADNLSELLDESAREFVNSLRGTQSNGKTLVVSRLYDEARPFYFPAWPTDLRQHLRAHSEADVAALIDATSEVEARLQETDIADLSKGEREPIYSNLLINGESPSISIDGAVARLLTERQEKLERILRAGGREGRVIVGQGESGPPKPPETVR